VLSGVNPAEPLWQRPERRLRLRTKKFLRLNRWRKSSEVLPGNRRWRSLSRISQSREKCAGSTDPAAAGSGLAAGALFATPAGLWTFFAGEPNVKPEVGVWIAAQRLNRLAQAAVAEAMAPLMLW